MGEHTSYREKGPGAGGQGQEIVKGEEGGGARKSVGREEGQAGHGW